jgi:N6-adenosine-specific RNA methylase IME4
MDGSLTIADAKAADRRSVSRNSFPTVRNWIAAGTRLRRIEFDKYELGDWWNAWSFGAGRKALVEGPSWRGPAYQTCKTAGRVAHRFPPGYRYRNMPFVFLEAVTAIAAAEPAAAGTILARADRQRWTLAQVRLEAARHRSAYDAMTGGDIATSIDDLIKADRTYNAIEADPPWTFGKWSSGNRGGHSSAYRKMEIDAICSLPVCKLATDRTHLFLWVPAAMLEESFAVFRAWGSAYGRTEIIWKKTQEFGTGWRVRMYHEHLLIGVMPRSPVWRDKTIGSIVEAPRGKLHSEKPPIFKNIIERAVAGPYLELFGRTARKGWTVCGDQMKPVRPVKGRPPSNSISER